MQCKHHHYLYVIDKKQLLNDIDLLDKRKILNKKALLSLGNNSLRNGIEEWTKGKWWVYYDRNPRHSKYKTHKILATLGYFKFFQVGCGKCEVCRVEKSKQWTVKGYCESKMWKNATFLTLTYNNENLPEDRKLCRAHMQGFWKKLRYHLYKNTKKAAKIDLTIERSNLQELEQNKLEEMFGRRKNKKPIRMINCGEYGPKTKRPHYHAVVWNFKPADMRRFSKDRRGYWLYTSAKINKIWGKGYVIIGNAETDTVAYVARYCTKKFNRTEEEQQRMKQKKQTEFIGASSLGFIGYYYWAKYKDKIKQAMGIFMKNKDHVMLAKIPNAMEKKWKEENPDEYDDYEQIKCIIGQENWKKILANTNLTEEEYIKTTYEERMKKYALLKRSKGDLG